MSAARTRVKICGCTSVRDAYEAVEAGADAVGVVMTATSPRRVDVGELAQIARHVPPFVTLVAVFVDAPVTEVRAAVALGAMPQFHGDEDAASCEELARGGYLKAFHVRDEAPVDAAGFQAYARPFSHATWLFDTARSDGRSGGAGRPFRWEIAQQLCEMRRYVVGGGLTPENVGDCVRAVRPYGVDVRSGVETDGLKDARKMRAFVDAVRAADATRPA